MTYTVSVVTYAKRFDEWLKPLLKEIHTQRPNVEVILSVNGERNHFDQVYRRKMLELVAEYPNVYPIFYPRFRSLSRIWNLAVQASPAENTLLLSDDISIEKGFFDEYEKVTLPSFSINLSFSAVSINKQELIDANWFEERYLGIGWEDGEFMERYKQVKNLTEFPNANIESCKNVDNPAFFKVHNPKLSEYIKNEKPEDRIAGQKRDLKHGRYSEFNRTVSLENPQRQYPYESFYLLNKNLL